MGKRKTTEPRPTEHTCHTPMFTGIIPGCKRCEEISNSFGFEPYAWHTMRQAQRELANANKTQTKEHKSND